MDFATEYIVFGDVLLRFNLMSFRTFKRRLLRRLGIIPPKYKSYVGPAQNFELMGTVQFDHLKYWGLAEHHYLLDIGCGSLREGGGSN